MLNARALEIIGKGLDLLTDREEEQGRHTDWTDEIRDVRIVLDELSAKIAGLEARNLCLEVRPEFRYVAQDKPETWPVGEGCVVLWFDWRAPGT